MNLLFAGIQPSADLEHALLSHGFQCHCTPKLSSKIAASDIELAIIQVGKALDTKALANFRSSHPLTWISLVVADSWLSDSNQLSDLLRCEDKNEVLAKKTWENTLWLSIQAALRHKKTLNEAITLLNERNDFKKQSNELTRHSRKLVKQLEHDVELATSIQRSLLPRVSPEIPGVSLAIKYLPAAGLGGDYYDIFEFDDRKRFGLLIADAPTHGMAAALLSVLVKVRLEEMKDRFPDSKSFVEYLNREIQQMNSKDRQSLSLLYGIIDRTTLTFQYTVAGPLRPLLWRKGEVPTLNGAGNPLLGETSHYNFRENSMKLEPGDLLVFFTDGLELPLGGNPFEKISQLLQKSKAGNDPQELQNELMGLVDCHVSREPLKDDITIIELAVHHKALYLASNGG